MRFLEKIIISFLFISSPALAEPSPTTAYLMEESVSLLTWGMFKVEQYILKSKMLGDNGVVVEYDWDQNSINIKVYFLQGQDRKECDNFIKGIKEIAGINTKNNGSIPLYETSFFADYFVNNGYQRKNRPKNSGKEIDNIMKIVVQGKDNGGIYVCESKMLQPQIFYSKIE